MKEKEIVQTIGETDPEMKELWPLVEKVMDEIEALRLREPDLGDKLDRLKREISEAKQNSRRMLAFHKDVMGTRWAIESITILEDTTRDNKITRWSKDYKHHEIINLADSEYADYDHSIHGMVIRKRPTKGSTKKLESAVVQLKKRTAELMSIRKKSDPKLKVPLYRQVLDRLAGTSFTASEGGKIGYQIQLERGQRPTSQSARLRKSLDLQNFTGEQVLGKVKKGLHYDYKTRKYTLAKDYQLYEPEPRPTKEQLQRAKKKYGELALKMAKLQQAVGRPYPYTYGREETLPKDQAQEMQKVLDQMNEANQKMPSYTSEKSALRAVGLQRNEQGYFVPLK